MGALAGRAHADPSFLRRKLSGCLIQTTPAMQMVATLVSFGPKIRVSEAEGAQISCSAWHR